MKQKAGIVLITKFTAPNGPKTMGFSGYVDYIERQEATTNELNFELNNNIIEKDFDNYLNYMDRFNGVFSMDAEKPDREKMREIKNIYQEAEKNNSIMWQDIISFKNEFLEKENIYNSKNNTLDEKRLYTASKKMMDILSEKEKLGDMYWVGAIHRNTDNIHIHFSIVEQTPTRPMKEFDGDLQRKGRRKQSTIDSMKSSFANELGIFQENYIDIGTKRDVAIENMKQINIDNQSITLNNKKRFDQTVEQLVSHLPEDWEYKVARNHVSYKYLSSDDKKLVDNAISLLASDNKELEYSIVDYHESIDKQNDKLIEAFGKKYNPSKDFKTKRTKDFNERLGNVFLKELGSYKREFNKHNNSKRKKQSELAVKKIDPERSATQSQNQYKKHGYSSLEKFFWRTQKNMEREVDIEMRRTIWQKRREDLQAYEDMISDIRYKESHDIDYS